MNTRHRIRLAGPWEAEILDSSSHQQLDNSVLKAVLGETDQPTRDPFSGNLKLRRNFNLPTGLDQHSIVWLCAEGFPIPDQCLFFLNQKPLPRTDPASNSDRKIEVPVTEVLESFNRIEIALSCSATVTPVLIAENAAKVLVQASVWLEIE